MILHAGETGGKYLSSQTRSSGLCNIKSNRELDPGSHSRIEKGIDYNETSREAKADNN